ncbi:MAG: triose-phosphate isomerase [Alphaproteobacteria bacterium]|nr:triose-phosphate isomerase [Alphaproteobacteria bacterium]
MKHLEKIIVGNWKMNGSVKSLAVMIEALKSVNMNRERVILCPPFTLLGAASVANVAFGAQDVGAYDSGAYTGEISAEMIAETGAKYAIVGHSERRRNYFETNEIISHKALAAHRAGLIPIICVGEACTGDECAADAQMPAAVEKQVKESVPEAITNFIIAYEPVWSVGTDNIPPAADIEKAHGHIYNVLAGMGKHAPVIYGGSVNATNSLAIMSMKGVDGVLVGRASLLPEEFIPIIQSGK